MTIKRKSTVVWNGSGKEGEGYISTESHALEKSHYAWNTRLQNEKGTNPEELIAAAHAACFTMKLSFLLSEAGFIPDMIETTAEVTLEKDSISQSHLTVVATVPAIHQEMFEEYADKAKNNCLVSKALNVKVTMDAALMENMKTM